MNQSLKFSIIMPSFNQDEYLERSILSVINQNYKNFELIIIDGGSDDRSIDIIKKYERHISYWVSEPDNGQSDALNKGFKIATGDIYCWLNSDDLFMPESFIQVSKTFETNPEKQIIFGDWVSINSHDQIIDHHYAFNFNINHLKYEGFHLNAQAMFWRSKVHQRFSGFDTRLYNTMDYQMMIEFGLICNASQYQRIGQTLGAFRRYEGQKTKGFNEGVLKEHKKIASDYKFSQKYSLWGKFLRIIYRFRRAIWYVRRGGVSEFIYRIRLAYWH